MTSEYIAALVSAYPTIVEIWLFGSRANGRERRDSDWDYLVFSRDATLLNALSQDRRFHQANIDLFVVVDEICFMRPWADEEGHHKKGYLDASAAGWHWRRISATEARYFEALDIPGPSMVTKFREAKAERVHPKRAVI